LTNIKLNSGETAAKDNFKLGSETVDIPISEVCAQFGFVRLLFGATKKKLLLLNVAIFSD